MTHRTCLTLATIGLMLGSSRASTAQYVQYTPPGTLGAPQVPAQELFEEAIRDARWQLGAVRLNPWLAVTNLGYIDNVFGTAVDPVSDITASVGAGIRGYLPTGEKSTFAMHFLPEYVWWQNLDGFRRFNGRVGGGWFGYFDRLAVDVDATYSKRQGYASSELQRPVDILEQDTTASFEWEFLERLSAFASGALVQLRYDDLRSRSELPVATSIEATLDRLVLLERNEDIVRAGARYQFASYLKLGLGVELTDVDFIHPERNRSYTGIAPLLEVVFDHPAVYGEFSTALPDTTPKTGSVFVPFDGITGRFLVVVNQRSPLNVQIYGRNNLVYSISLASPYFEDRRFGGALLFPLGWRIQVNTFVETGVNDYTMYNPKLPTANEDVFAYGGGVAVELTPKSSVYFRVSSTSYDSIDPSRDRSIFRFQVSLSLGSGDNPWW